MPGNEPVEQGCPHPADVQETGGAGRESRAYHHETRAQVDHQARRDGTGRRAGPGGSTSAMRVESTPTRALRLDGRALLRSTHPVRIRVPVPAPTPYPVGSKHLPSMEIKATIGCFAPTVNGSGGIARPGDSRSDQAGGRLPLSWTIRITGGIDLLITEVAKDLEDLAPGGE